jgi:TRAP-type C4-dicarboxylate transport system permease large subunit
MRDVWSSFIDATALTAQVYFLILGGLLFSRFVAFSGVLGAMVEWVGNLPIPPMGIMFILVVMYLIMGCILDPVSMLVITIPFVYPIVTALGWDGISFGVILIILVEMAVITPPIGFNVFAVASAAGIPASTVFLYCLPFYFTVMILLWLIILFPKIATCLI